jgi:hypothetical protein
LDDHRQAFLCFGRDGLPLCLPHLNWISLLNFHSLRFIVIARWFLSFLNLPAPDSVP